MNILTVANQDEGLFIQQPITDGVDYLRVERVESDYGGTIIAANHNHVVLSHNYSPSE